jgi:hypothetical protein
MERHQIENKNNKITWAIVANTHYLIQAPVLLTSSLKQGLFFPFYGIKRLWIEIRKLADSIVLAYKYVGGCYLFTGNDNHGII